MKRHIPTRLVTLTAKLALVAGLAPLMTGCESDSWMWDPSVMGRWEHTPTRVPVLSRLASIEGPEDDFVEVSDVKAEDLLPEVTEYRIGPGDRLAVLTYDLPDEGRVGENLLLVDARGMINIPQLGELNVSGRTTKEAELVVMQAMRDLVANPLASIRLESQRQLRFSVFGGVQSPGLYQVPSADYKLLEGLTAAGGFSESPEYIYVIRQVTLTEAAGAGRVRALPPPGQAPARPQDDLGNIIDELSRPSGATPPAGPGGTAPGGTAPGGTAPGGTAPGGTPRPQPTPPKPPPGSPSMLRAQPAGQSGGQPGGQPAPIDLIDPKAPSVRPSAASVSAPAGNEAAPTTPPPPPPPPASESAPAPSSTSGEGSWVFIEGRWVNVARPAAATPGLAGEVVPGSGPRSEALVTQRVIRIPVQRLVSGDARYNIVLRPGDIVRVPPQPTGTIFIGGQIARAGSYNMLERLTLTNALTAAGGLTQTAVPERVDLRRMVSTDQVAIVRLNVRAIFEGTHPDIFLKPNDQIIIGTNFWATPLAIIRNGFRATYGFGFLVDRNFGSDIFGVPPEAFDQGRNRDGLINLF